MHGLSLQVRVDHIRKQNREYMRKYRKRLKNRQVAGKGAKMKIEMETKYNIGDLVKTREHYEDETMREFVGKIWGIEAANDHIVYQLEVNGDEGWRMYSDDILGKVE